MPRLHFITLAILAHAIAVEMKTEEPRAAASQPVATVPLTTQPAASQPMGVPPSPPPPEDSLPRLQDAFEALVEKVGPAVVAIQTDRRPSPGERPAGSPLAWVTSGSGVVIRSDGMILTSQHVIEGALAIHVTLHDGRSCRARRVAADPRSDLAIVQIAERDLAIAELGDVRGVRRGHLVLALGNPLGLAGDGQAAVSLGIVSAIGRPLPGTVGQDEDRYYGDMIQTSAPVNPGHSGGPLVDIRGRVVGVLTAVSTSGESGGIAFAVPIGARTRRIIDRLLTGQSVDYGYLGVEVVNLTEAQMRAAGLPSGRGVLVDSVIPGEPASVAGLQGGDILLAVDRRSVASADDFISMVGALEPGRTADVEYLRGDRRTVVPVTVERRPASPTVDSSPGAITFRGAVLESVSPAMREANHLPPSALLVVLVTSGTPADRAGLTPGDIIVRVDGRPLSADTIPSLPAQAEDCLMGLASGQSLLIKAE